MARKKVQRRAASKPKAPQKPRVVTPPPPNFPQHNLPAPYARLLTLGKGEFPAIYDEIAGELRAGDAVEVATKLRDMVLDETYYDYYPLYSDEDDYFKNETRLWTPLHAL